MEAAPPKGASKKADGKKETKTKGGKKQLSIATMFKPPPTRIVKKKQEAIVRITNSSGFGMLTSNIRSNVR